MAFTQTNARLILGYSSVAQLGFITLGIFAADNAAAGAQGALMQAIQHGLVVAPMLLVIVLLAERVGRLGGHPRHGRDRVPRARARRAVPGRDAGDAGDAGLGELRRRVPDPARDVQRPDGVRVHRLDRRRARLGLRAAALHPLDAQPHRAGGDVVRDVAARRRSCSCRSCWRSWPSRSSRRWRSTTPSGRSSARWRPCCRPAARSGPRRRCARDRARPGQGPGDRLGRAVARRRADRGRVPRAAARARPRALRAHARRAGARAARARASPSGCRSGSGTRTRRSSRTRSRWTTSRAG